MQVSDRKLGWIAIAIGVLALLVAFGRPSPGTWWGRDGYGYRGEYERQEQVRPPAAAPDVRGGAPGSDRFAGPPRFHDGPPMFFFLPFMIAGKLAKLALFVLLALLALRWLRHRDQGGPGQTPSQPQQPGPEPGPYTSDTQRI